MKKIEAPGIVLPRLKQHRAVLNAILNDSRISGSRRMLGMLLAAWLDLYEHPDQQKEMMALMQGVWGDAKRTRWVDEGEPPINEDQSNLTKDTTQTIKSLFDTALKESNVEVPGEKFYMPRV